mgnify:CR=1 FL=1
MTQALDRSAAVAVLNRILELELAGVVRYTHYAFMVNGYSRIPIVGWLNAQADESLLHARQAGELVTSLGGHPSLGIGPLLGIRLFELFKCSLQLQDESFRIADFGTGCGVNRTRSGGERQRSQRGAGQNNLCHGYFLSVSQPEMRSGGWKLHRSSRGHQRRAW